MFTVKVPRREHATDAIQRADIGESKGCLGCALRGTSTTDRTGITLH